MVSKLIDFALVVLELFMFKVCGTTGISKIEFFNFSSNERFKYWSCQNQNFSWCNFERISTLCYIH